MASRIVALAALFVGFVGVFLAFYPSVLNTEKDCPWLSRNAPAVIADLAAFFGIANSVPPGPVDPADGLRWFTLDELAGYDGSDESKPIMLAVKGFVFDVTEKGSQYYGKGKVRS
jgi:hypothetical protein